MEAQKCFEITGKCPNPAIHAPWLYLYPRLRPTPWTTLAEYAVRSIK
jgi:hypothetical protein